MQKLMWLSVGVALVGNAPAAERRNADNLRGMIYTCVALQYEGEVTRLTELSGYRLHVSSSMRRPWQISQRTREDSAALVRSLREHYE